MSGSHLRSMSMRWFLPIAAAPALSCSDGATGPDREPASFTLEQTRAVTRTIGIEGGTP
jgi:hypothetical protein